MGFPEPPERCCLTSISSPTGTSAATCALPEHFALHVQLVGSQIVPFGANKQTLLLDALYNEVADSCQIATARPGEVHTTS